MNEKTVKYFAPSLHNNEYSARVESGFMNSAPPEVVLATDFDAVVAERAALRTALIDIYNTADENLHDCSRMMSAPPINSLAYNLRDKARKALSALSPPSPLKGE